MKPLEVLFLAIAICQNLDLIGSQAVEIDYSSLEVEGQILPDLVNVTLTTDTNTSHLQLSRVEHIHLDIPLYSLSVDSNGTFSQRRESSRDRKNIGYYQDIHSEAVFQLTRTDNIREKKAKLIIKGEYKQNGDRYFIQPEVTPVQQATTTRSPSDGVVYTRKLKRNRPAGNMDYVIPPPEILSKSRRNKMTRTLKNRHSNATSDQSPPLKRDRRAADSTYYIDVIAVIDYAAYNRFYQRSYDKTKAMEDIHEYYAFIFNGVDLLYQGITSTPYKLRVRLNRIYVADTRTSSQFTVGYSRLDTVDCDKALTAFTSFAGRSDLLFVYDHAMLFTGYDLTDVNAYGVVSHGVIGYAHIGTLCRNDGMSTSVIEDMSDYQSIDTAAHELGHSLSAQHDGLGNTCRFSDRYIMAASDSKETWTTLYHPWQFSPCSVRYFTDYITSQLNTLRGYHCLTGRIPIEQDIPYTGDQLLGQMYTPDQQCQLVYGPTSYLCRGLHGTEPASICRDMYCQDPEDPDMCIAIRAARGTTCGNGRICENGHCVPHADAPHVDVTCMYGDEPGRIGDYSSCKAMVDDFIGFCSRDSLFASCCSSCNAVKRTVQGCEFGDYYTDCVTSHCYDLSMRTKCCEKCNIGVHYTTRSTPTTRPSTTTAKRCMDDTTYTDGGRHCSSIVQNSPYLCYEQEVKAACCMSCQQVNTSEAGCEYGDKAPSWCGHPDACTKFPDKCCGTCYKTGSGIGYGTPACIDDSNFRLNGRSCSSAVETFKGNCYNTDFQQTCCHSCLNARNVSDIAGCEYGDRKPSNCFHKYSCNNYKADCCAYCQSEKYWNTSTRLQLSIFLIVMVSALKMFSIL